MNKLIIYHGSSEIIQNPQLEKGKIYNDYGQGFYCTENLELAKEWACTEGIDGYVNKYELPIKDLKILNLSDEKHTILNWLAILVTYRKIRLSTPTIKKAAEWLKEKILIDVEEYDLIIGYRADDSYFSFARAFLNNEISISQLSYAMKLGKLGEQIVLKSAKSFQRIHFISCELANNKIYYPKRKVRDERAREAFVRELEKEELNGLYIRDILLEEVDVHDPRLR